MRANCRTQGRFPRAHALATLALKALGKRTLCLEVPAGKLSGREFYAAWRSHVAELEHSYVEAISPCSMIGRIFAWYENNADTRMRGLYVDANPTGPDGPPLLPGDVDPGTAAGIVQTAEAAAMQRWLVVLDYASYRKNSQTADRSSLSAANRHSAAS